MVPAVISTSSPPRARGLRIGALPAVPGWSLCSLALISAVVIERWLLSHFTFPGDLWGAHLGMSPKPWLIFAITRCYQQVGRPLVALAEVLAMLAWLWYDAGRRAAVGLLIALPAAAMCFLIKDICGPTPLWQTLPHHVGSNFPSGVVTFMTASVGYLAAVQWRRGRSRAAGILVAAIVASGPARVLGGQHLPSDVLAAYLLGLAWLIPAYRYLQQPQRCEQEDTPWNIVSLEAPA